jgi:rod shape-determining protein MreD
VRGPLPHRLPRLDNAAASLLPVTTMVLATILSMQPIGLSGYAALTPALSLMVAYHWTIYRPDLLPPTALFTIGTIQDLLCGGLPGVTALLLLLARGVVLKFRHHFLDRPFAFVWLGFALLTGGAMILMWTLHSLLAAELLDIRGTALCALLTISGFPVASFLLGRSQRALMT